MKRFLIAAAAPLFLSACGGSGDGTTLSSLADDLISYVTTGRTVAENQRVLVAGQGCDSAALLFGEGDCKVGSGAGVASGFVARDTHGVGQQLSGAQSTIYAVNAPSEDWSNPGGYARLHPYHNSADMVIVAVPPAASQLDGNGTGAGSITSPGKADSVADDNGNASHSDADISATPEGAVNSAPATGDDAVAPAGGAGQQQPSQAAGAAMMSSLAGADRVPAEDGTDGAVPAKASKAGATAGVTASHATTLPPAPNGAKGAKNAISSDAKPQAPAQDGSGEAAKDTGDKDFAPLSKHSDAAANVGSDGPSVGGGDGKYVVLGSFTSHKRAQNALVQYAQYHPQLIPAMVAGTPYLRIAVGPMNMSRANDLRLVTAKNGIKDSWIVSMTGSGE